MELSDNLNTKVKLVGMSNADISTLQKPIIGTIGLATCVGVLLYNEDKKLAIVAHLSTEWIETIKKVFKIISMYKLDSSIIKYKVISGYYPNNYHVKEEVEKILEEAYPVLVSFDDKELSDNDIGIDEETESKRFAFDSLNGKFVTKFINFDQIVSDNDYKNKRK